MAGKAFRDLVAQPQFEIVPMRTDQADAAFQLGLPAPRQRVQQRGFDELRAGATRFRGAAVDEFHGPAVDEFHAAAVADGRRPRPGSQQLAGLFHLGGELVDQIDTGSDELGTVRGQMPVPDVQGVQDSAIAAMTGSRKSFG